jgi:dTDP-4-dehydrorhamnose reductase
MRVVVTGAGGQVGRALVSALGRRGVTPTALDRAALDVGDEAGVRRVLAEHAPDLVLHTAAWTDVDGAEADEDGASRVNAHGTRVVARAAAAVGARLVAYSTDFVFDGRRDTPYVESDPVAPLSAYGRTKLAGERAALEEHPDGTWVVRTAWVFDEVGTNFVRTILRLAASREEVAVVSDQRGSPTYAPDLAEATLDLLDACPPGVHHLAGGGSCTRLEWARAVVEDAGLPCRVTPTTSAAFPTPARRPASSALRSEHACTPVLPSWRDGVRRCVTALEVVR